ncbi:hypothetical protein P3T39_007417 [Kitasatospora sp. GP82]|nr:hypothetical protein [Kitasatospora sp. GP82]
MTEEGPLPCPMKDCGRQVAVTVPNADGVRDWHCPGCGSFGYTLPLEYVAHTDEPFLQRVGRLTKTRKNVTV